MSKDSENEGVHPMQAILWTLNLLAELFGALMAVLEGWTGLLEFLG